MRQLLAEYHLQHRAEFDCLNWKTDRRCNRGGDLLPRRGPGIGTISRRHRRIRPTAGGDGALRGDVDIQTAAAVGAVFWNCDFLRGGNVGVRQFAKVSGRSGDASRIVSTNGDRDGSQRRNLQRQSHAGGQIAKRQFACLKTMIVKAVSFRLCDSVVAVL